MSETAPAARTRDSTIVAVAWAVAAVVVALVAAFIAWLAMGDRGSDPAPAPAADSAVTDAPAPTEGAAEQDGAPAPDQNQGDQAAPTPERQEPPQDVLDLMLSLQRRDGDDVMAIGEVDAPVVMIEYADYRCPYCARYHLTVRPELMDLVEDGTLRMEFRDLVIFDEASQLAAVGGRAAAEQGLLEEYQHAVFSLSTEGHGEYGQEELMEIAEEIGVPDLEAFEAAFTDEEILAAVEADTTEGRSIGINSTPTFLINSQVVQGAQPAPSFRHLIEQEIGTADAAVATASPGGD